MNENIEKPTMQLPPLKKICMTIGQLPVSYVETMSYYEMLVWFVHYLRDYVIPVVNANGEAVEELQELYTELQDYVNNYFDNLDVQEEINNKLDEMAESGQLTDIIAQYLGLAGMITFNNVAEMKLAENLVNGSKCCTLGYHNVNDGGNALYKIRTITNDDVVDEMFIIAVYDDSLVAELISNDSVNIKQLGAYGDGTHDDLSPITTAISKFNRIIFNKGTYNISDNITINNKIIEGNGATINTISQTTSREHQIIVEGSSIIKDLIMKQSNHGVSLCGFIDNTDTLIENCTFKVDNVTTNGYVDLYTNNKNVSFINCIFDVDSYTAQSALTIGGIWVREHTEDTTTENIKFLNCTINHNTTDESIAIWNWNGSVKDVLIDNCIITAKDTCTSPHFISLDADRCILSNSIIDGPTASSNSILKGDFYNQVNNCIIYSHKQENNGISSGNIIFNGCKIYNDNENCYLSVNKKNIYKNCEIEVNALTDTRSIELYNCHIKSKSETSTNKKFFIKDVIMKNCTLDIKACANLIESYWSDPLNIDIENCKIAIETGGFVLLQNNTGVTHSIKIFNNYLTRGTITAYSGHVSTGFVIGNVSSTTIPETITGLTMANNVTLS